MKINWRKQVVFKDTDELHTYWHGAFTQGKKIGYAQGYALGKKNALDMIRLEKMFGGKSGKTKNISG